VASYFAVYKGQEKGLARLATAADDHPAVRRAYDMLLPAWEEVCALGAVSDARRPDMHACWSF
jgi:hypothetical protein